MDLGDLVDLATSRPRDLATSSISLTSSTSAGPSAVQIEVALATKFPEQIRVRFANN